MKATIREKLYMIIHEQFILIQISLFIKKKNKAKDYSLIIFLFFLSLFMEIICKNKNILYIIVYICIYLYNYIYI